MEDTRTVHPVPASPATGGGRNHIGEPPHALSPLRLSSCRRDIITSTPVDEQQQQQPDSPTSPTSCTLPNGYSPVMIRDDYGLPPPPENQEEAHYYNNNNSSSSTIASYTSRDKDALQSNQDVEPFNCYGDMYRPPGCTVDPCVAVRQHIAFAETSLKCYNDDSNNEVKYELIEAIESNVMIHGIFNYAHVNFTARAKEEGSQQELFFAELNLRGQAFTTLTCFRSLKEKDDHVGGRLELEREGDGIDLDHCYACLDVLKHPRDGASYHAGHRTRRRRYEFP